MSRDFAFKIKGEIWLLLEKKKSHQFVLLCDNTWLLLRGAAHFGKGQAPEFPSPYQACFTHVWYLSGPWNTWVFNLHLQNAASQRRGLGQKGVCRTPKYSISNYLPYLCCNLVLMLVSASAKNATSWIEVTPSLTLNYPSSERSSGQLRHCSKVKVWAMNFLRPPPQWADRTSDSKE